VEVICYDLHMTSSMSTLHRDSLEGLARSTPDLDLLLLYGSRARGDSRAQSDWDFGYVGGPQLDAAGLLAGIVEVIRDDRVDLVNLATAGALLRYRSARDGVVLYESRPRLGEQFRLDAADFWCDAQPVLQRGYQAALERI
jgi:predicted nucleotidyltransferase